MPKVVNTETGEEFTVSQDSAAKGVACAQARTSPARSQDAMLQRRQLPAHLLHGCLIQRAHRQPPPQGFSVGPTKSRVPQAAAGGAQAGDVRGGQVLQDLKKR